MKIFLTALVFIIPVLTFSQTLKSFDDLETLYNNEDYKACIKLEKQIEQLSLNKKDTIAANAFSNLGDSFFQLGIIDKAISWQEREKKLREELHLQKNDAFSTCLYNLANSYMEANRYNEAVSTAQQLVDNDKNLFGWRSEQYASSVINASDILIRADKFQHSEKLLVTSSRQQEKNSIIQGILMTKLGDLYTITSQFTKASRTLLSAVEILTKNTGDRSKETTAALLNLGLLYMAQNKLPEAEEIFDNVLGTMSTDDASFVATLNNKAIVYQNLGQLQRAEQTFKKLLAIDSVEVGTDHSDFAISLSNLGLVYIQQTRYQQAEQTLTRALSIQKRNNESKSVSYAIKLNNLARAYQSTGNFDNATKLYQEALGIFKKTLGENSPTFATTTFNLGMTLWKSGKGGEGIKYIKQSAAIRAAKLGKKHPKYAESIQKIAEYHWEKKQLKEARNLFNEVFTTLYFQIESTFPGLTEEEKMKFYYNNIKPSFEKFNAFALESRAIYPDIIGEVLDNQINTKGSILYATEKVKQAIVSSNDSLLIDKFEMWQTQREQIAKAYSENTSPSALDSLQQSANRLEKELSRQSIVFQNQIVRKKTGWRDVQKNLKENEVAIETIRFNSYSPQSGGVVGDKIFYAFLIVQKSDIQPQVVVLDNGHDLENKLLNFYRNSIKFTLEDKRSFDNFFKPLFDFLQPKGVTRIYFSPDGVYNQINLNTIKTPDGKFLIDVFDIRLITNTREIVDRKVTKSQSQSSVLIGFPKFNFTTGTQADDGNSRSITRNANLTRGLRGGLLRYMRGESGIASLPGTQIEIQKISSIAKDPKIYIEQNASEDVIKTLKNPELLHIATHGYFLEEEESLNTTGNAVSYFPNPLLKSGLILAGAESFLKTGVPVNAAGDDGILTAYEAMNLTLDETDLVVLSACETGLGEIKNGEGVYGLQRAFKLAGATNLIMSLWSVDDAATQELMTSFYEERLKTKDTPTAFRIAQQKLKQKFPHPFYWGAFILVGI